MSDPRTAQPVTEPPAPTAAPPAGLNGSLNGQGSPAIHSDIAVEGQDSPQAISGPSPTPTPPAGHEAAQPATLTAIPSGPPLAGHQASRDHDVRATQAAFVPGASIPGAHRAGGTQTTTGTGDQAPPAAPARSSPNVRAPLADPLLALAADVLSDLEKVRIANENRLRQLTRSTEDADGEVRGFGLDESHPDVARLAALVGMLAEAEHKATLNLGRLMRANPLGPWVASMKGVGEKQAARLLAAIGDPYIRPEIVREDGAVEPSRPRMVSELWALCGYHVIDGSAPRRARGQKANWSTTAKMRAFLVAESCMKQSGTPYRAVYDAARAKYADAVHATECIRCGPAGKPAQPGSALSDGHKHARALRAVAKEVLRDLWREAKRLHEQAPVSSHTRDGTHALLATDGPDIPADQAPLGSHKLHVGGEQDEGCESAA